MGSCFTLKDALQAMCNTWEFTDALSALKLSDLEWQELKAVVDFLCPESKLTSAASGSSYASLSFQPLVYESLRTHCFAKIARPLESGINVAAAKRAAEIMLEKPEKYKEHMKSSLCLLVAGFDPSVPLPDREVPELMSQIRQLLTTKYGYQQQHDREVAQLLTFFVDAKLARSKSAVHCGKINEVYDILALKKRADISCNDVLEW